MTINRQEPPRGQGKIRGVDRYGHGEIRSADTVRKGAHVKSVFTNLLRELDWVN